MKFCNNCGTAITEADQKFCPGCGANLAAQEIPVAPQQSANYQAVAPEAPGAPAYEAPVAPVATGESMFWHEALSKKLMNIAAIVLIILGVLMWTGGIYQHVIFRMSEEGQIARMGLSFIQGEYNDAIEEPSGLVDDMIPAGAGDFREMDSQGKMMADGIDSADLSFTSDYLYEQYGLMQFVDIIFGVIMIALGLFAYTVGQNLSQYKRDAVQMLDTYNIAVLGAVVIYGLLYNFVLSPFSDIFEIFTLPYFVIVLLLVASLVFNKKYYEKRQNVFVY